MPRFIKLANGRVGIQTQVIWLQNPWSTCSATSAKPQAVEVVGTLVCLGIGLTSLWP